MVTAHRVGWALATNSDPSNLGIQTEMKTPNPRTALFALKTIVVTVLTLAGLSTSPLRADTVVIQTGSAAASACPAGSYSDGSGTSTAGGFTGTASTTYRITATLNPPVYQCAAYGGVRYNAGGGAVNVNPYMNLTPTLSPGGTAANFKPGADANTAIYLVRGARVSDASGGARTYSLNYTGCSGPAASGSANTTFFASGGSTLNAWNTITTIALNPGVTTPTVKFVAKTINTARTYANAFCFIQEFSPAVTSIGSMVAGETTSVVVGGCSASAAGVYLYDTSDNYTLIGQNTAPGGASSVTISGINPALLIAGHVIHASQDVPVTLNSVVYHRLGDPTVTAGTTVTVTGSADPCSTVADVGGVTAPVYRDAATVTVTGVASDAEAVTIYDNSTQVGQNTSPGSSGTVAVAVTGTLTQGHLLKATQTRGGQESCLNTAPSATIQGFSCASVATVDIRQSGPIQAGQTEVVVTGVSGSASAVKVYKGASTLLGTLSSGIVAGENTVTVSALAKGDVIFATQTVGAYEGCTATHGVSFTVGSGAPNIRFALGIRNTAGAAAPLGSSAGGTGTIYILGANGGGSIAQYTAPTGIPSKNIITAGLGWQTISFVNGTDPTYNFSSGSAGPGTIPGNAGAGGSSWAALEGLYIVPDDSMDTGPYTIYIDNVKNGDDVLQSFEGSDDNANAVLFNLPGFSGTTGNSILGVPNISKATIDNPDVGTKCAVVEFQFKAVNAGNWDRLTTSSANVQPNASVDISKPITMRVLVLPAGGSAALNVSQPANKVITTTVADSVSITATDNTGSGTLSYQWKKNGSPIADATDSSLSFSDPSSSDQGSYTCEVSDVVGGSTYTSECNPFTVTLNNRPVAQSFSMGAFSGVAATVRIIGSEKYAPSDTDSGDTLTVNSVDLTTANGGTASVSTDKSSIIYTAPSGQTADSFTYTITDGKGVSLPATVSVAVSAGGGQSPNYVTGSASYADGTWTAQFRGIPGVTYGIERRDIEGGSWTRIGTVEASSTPGSEGLITVTDPPLTVEGGGTGSLYRTVYP